MEIKWQPEYSVGIQEIDLQHQKFFEIINRLAEAQETKNNQEVLHALANLAGYTDEHFSTEENYFDKFNYEGADEHKAEHNKFKKKIDEFLARLQKKDENVAEDMAKFTDDWMQTHMQNMDKKYVKCFHEHGLY